MNYYESSWIAINYSESSWIVMTKHELSWIIMNFHDVKYLRKLQGHTEKWTTDYAMTNKYSKKTLRKYLSTQVLKYTGTQLHQKQFICIQDDKNTGTQVSKNASN